MTKPSREHELATRVAELEAELARLRSAIPFRTAGDTVRVPPEMRPTFDAAQETVRQYFQDTATDPSQASISISGDRYLLVRASSLSVGFLNTIKSLYADLGDEAAFQVGRNFLFDISHVIGVEDAKNFHKKMGVTDPLAKLSAGPVLFAYCGWAFVDIDNASRPVPTNDYFIKYTHPYSFEADAWIKAGQQSDRPVCIMNCGYSSGWCEESFGLPLTAVEVTCRAAGDETCTFIMAPPERIEGHLANFVSHVPQKTVQTYQVPSFFERKRVEEELKASRHRAEESDRMKSEFLANMSHEIRTPMNAIIGMTDLVLDTELESTQREYLKMVSESAETLLTIINEILDFSKIEAGKLSLEETEFDLRDELGDTLKSLAIRASAQHLDLVWSVDPEVPSWLQGDPGRLRQMIVNLVGNAIKFTSEGQIVVGVGLSPEAVEESTTDHVQLHFWVSDTGVGIPADKLALIFSAFQQADSSTTREFGGTGLGLAITARLAEAMGGRIWVDSKIGQGSTFHFTANFIRLEPPVQLAVSDISSVKILLVESNPILRDFLQQQLQGWGFPTHVAEDGPSVLRRVQEDPAFRDELDLLIADTHLKGLDGFQVVSRLRADPRFHDVPVVMLTSAGNPAEGQRCEEMGIRVHLIKPVKPSELLDGITSCFRMAPPDDTQDSESAANPVMSSMRVLVAEDGLANQKMALGLLKKWGHQVTVVSNGQRAIEAWQSDPYDVILMDVQMPVLDGLEATRQIRDQEQFTGSHIPIVAMTARAMKGDREKCLEAGMDDYVSKPIRRAELERALVAIRRPGSIVAPSSSAASDVIDWEAALEIAGGDRDLLDDVLLAAVEEIQALLGQLENCQSPLDALSIGQLAHTIKGSARAVAATATQVAAETIEQAAASQRLDDFASLVANLKSAAAQFALAVERAHREK